MVETRRTKGHEERWTFSFGACELEWIWSVALARITAGKGNFVLLLCDGRVSLL